MHYGHSFSVEGDSFILNLKKNVLQLANNMIIIKKWQEIVPIICTKTIDDFIIYLSSLINLGPDLMAFLNVPLPSPNNV
jgi:hypothetical protein